MLKRLTSIALAALVIGSMTSCILDPDPKPIKDDCTTGDCDKSQYKDLTEDWHVLYNLRLAYNEMNINEYRRIFDVENFTFFFAEGDVGGDIPVQWGYALETESALNMFTGQSGTRDNAILTINLSLFDIQTVQWVEIVNPEGFPGETWRQAIVAYDFFIDTEKDIQFITAGAPTAEFTVREIDGKWKLVAWRDRGGS